MEYWSTEKVHDHVSSSVPLLQYAITPMNSALRTTSKLLQLYFALCTFKKERPSSPKDEGLSLPSTRTLTRMFHELLWRDHEDGRATGQPQGVGPEAYLHGTS